MSEAKLTWSVQDPDAWKWKVFIDGRPAERLYPRTDPSKRPLKGFPHTASVKDGKVVLVLANENGIVEVKKPRLLAVRGKVEIRRRG